MNQETLSEKAEEFVEMVQHLSDCASCMEDMYQQLVDHGAVNSHTMAWAKMLLGVRSDFASEQQKPPRYYQPGVGSSFIYLGQYKSADLYYKKLNDTVYARYGNGETTYICCPRTATNNRAFPLKEAIRIVNEKRLHRAKS